MALKLKVSSLDGLPEDVAKEYTERDGAFFLDWTGVDGLEVDNVGGLKRSLESVRGELRTAETNLRAFEVDGTRIDAADAKSALTKVGEMAGWDPDKEVAEKIAAREAQLIKKHGDETKLKDDRNMTLLKQLEEKLIDQAATVAIVEAGGGKRIKMLMPTIRDQIRMSEKDGKFIAEVVDAAGNQRVGDGQGNPMTIPQLVAELKASDEFDLAFEGTGQTGTGGGGDDGDKGSRRTSSDGGGVVIDAGDTGAMDASLEDIASGKVKVRMSGS